MLIYRIAVIVLLTLALIGAAVTPVESGITVDSNLGTNFIQVDSDIDEIVVPLNPVSIKSNIQSSEDPVSVEYKVTNERTGQSVNRTYNYNITEGEVSANHALTIDTFSSDSYPIDSNTDILLKIEATHPEIGTDITTEEFSVVRSLGSIVYNVNNPNPTKLTDYQVKLNVDHRNGMGSNFENINFKQNGTSIPHWIEDYSAEDSATIWVKTNKLHASAETELKLTYADSVSGTNSPESVFNFYDGFNDGSIGSEWTDQAGGSITEENGVLKVSTGNLHTSERVVEQPGTKIETEAEFQSGSVEQNDNSGLIIGDPGHEGGNSGGHANVLNIIDDPSSISAWAGDGSSSSYNICGSKSVSQLQTDKPTILGISDPPLSDEIRLYTNNQKKQTCFGQLTGAGTDTFVIGLGHFALSRESDTTDTNYDWVRTRKQAESPVSVSRK